MGVDKTLPAELLESLRPFKRRSRLHESSFKARIALTSAWQFTDNRHRVLKFIREFDEIYDELEELDYRQKRPGGRDSTTS